MKKVLIAILVLIAVTAVLYMAYIVVGGLFLGGAFRPAINYERMEEIFDEDYELLIIVRDYLKNSTYEHIYIHSTMDRREMSVRGHRTEIEDIKTIEAIDALMNLGYSAMGKNGNTIYFLRWSVRNAGRGIVYSIDGNEPTETNLQFLTGLEPLSVSNWYYYEEDFNEWRRRNSG